jgi:hypothetical protein
MGGTADAVPAPRAGWQTYPPAMLVHRHPPSRRLRKPGRGRNAHGGGLWHCLALGTARHGQTYPPAMLVHRRPPSRLLRKPGRGEKCERGWTMALPCPGNGEAWADLPPRDAGASPPPLPAAAQAGKGGEMRTGADYGFDLPWGRRGMGRPTPPRCAFQPGRGRCRPTRSPRICARL